MRIFLKYIMKSMFEKKGRFVLLIIAITLSTCLFVASLGVVDIAINSISKPILETYDNKEIIINPKDQGMFFSLEGIKEKGIKSLQKEIEIYGKINDNKEDEILNVVIRGREEKNIHKNKFVKGNIKNFAGEKCIISKRVSDDRNLKVGDKIEVIIAGVKTNLQIQGIYANESIFYNDTKNNFTLILPYEYLSKNLGVENKYNLVSANASKKDVKNSIEKFNENNDKFTAEKLFDEDMIKEQTSGFTQSINMMLVIVVFMSAMIIYSTFKLIITERMPIVGTFLSQGATIKTIERILYLESIIYGTIGTVFGGALGIVALTVINRILSPLKDYGIYESVNVKPSYIIYGAIFAILLSFMSSLVPIKKIKKIEVKDVILNNVNVSMHIGWKKFIAGVIILISSVAVNYIDANITNTISPVFMFLTIIGIILIYPKVIELVTNIIVKFLRGNSKILFLSLNNLKTSKVLLGNISLIVVSLIAIFMITSLATSLKDMVTDAYYKLNYDIDINNISTVRQGEETTSDQILSKLNEYDEYVKDSSVSIYETYGKINKDNMINIISVDPDKYCDFNKYLELDSGMNKEQYDKFLKNRRGIVISTALSKNLNIKEGDTVALDINGISKKVKVVSIIEGRLFYNGYFSFISEEAMKDIFEIKGATHITININNNPSEFKKELKFLSKDYGVTITTRDENLKANIKSNEMIVNILSIFSYMAIIIAALGIFNNITIGFIQRKRELAVLSSVGMQKKNRNIMIVIESVITVIWSVIISVPGSILVIGLLTKTLTQMDMPLYVSLDYSQVPVYLIASLIIIIIATLPVVFKSNKLSIIEELKYE